MTGLAEEIRDALEEAAMATGGKLDGYLLRRGEASGPAYAPTYGPDTRLRLSCVQSSYTAYERDGTNILATDIKVLADATGPVPTPADRLELAGRVYEIVDAQPVAPAGVPLMWRLQVRG